MIWRVAIGYGRSLEDYSAMGYGEESMDYEKVDNFFSIFGKSGINQLGSSFIRSPKVLRGLAARARAKSDWATDAYYRRKICNIQPGRGANWLQLGHSLKELGQYISAEKAYLRAKAVGVNPADINIQLAHIAKIRGDFKSAAVCFREALRHGYAFPSEITHELSLLQRIDNSVIHTEKVAGFIDNEPHIYLSAPVAAVSDRGGAERPTGMGKADYSYAFAMRGFIRALEDMGRNYTVIKHPEFVSDIREQSNSKINIHLGFYPAERLRLLKGAYNINCFAWEFDRLRLLEETISYHAFADQTTMLNLVDEVWAPSKHGALAIAQTVSKPVYTVAAPILGDLRPTSRDAPPSIARIRSLAAKLDKISWQPLAVFSRVQTVMNQAAAQRSASLFNVLKRMNVEQNHLIFVSILNVHDWRKQLYPLLEGFIQVRDSCPNATLLIKASTPLKDKHPINSHVLGEQIEDSGSLPRPLVSDRVWITDEVFTREEMNALFDLGAFYVCTSYAEGQNLPLLEAMGRGSVPVSVNHTAMADYITQETGIVIHSEPRDFGPRLTARYGLLGLKTNFVMSPDVRDAIETASGLSQHNYARKSAAAMQIIRTEYGISPLTKAIDRVINDLKGKARDLIDA